MTIESIYDAPNVAMIPPIPDVHWTSGMTFHLCEAPIVLNSDRYALYYKWHSDRGHYVILDNGAAIGGTIDDEQIIEAAKMVGASEIVVPDEMANPEMTLFRAKQFLEKWKGDETTTLMFVPQGTDFKSWVDSLNDLMRLAEVTKNTRIVIGIGKHMHARIPEGRTHLAEVCHHYGLTCHILGASDDPLADVHLLSHPAVRGLDTSLPFVMAQIGATLMAEAVYGWPSSDIPPAWCIPSLEGKRPPLDFYRTSDMLGRTNLEKYLGWVAVEYDRAGR